MLDLSVVILTKNEERNIIDCLESIPEVKEIIIVDDYSSDRTIEVAKSVPIKFLKIYKRKLNKNFSAQRNFALSKVPSEWTLFLDADERGSGQLWKEIEEKLSGNKFSGFYIKRQDVIWGKVLRYGEVGRNRFLRLAKTTSGVWKGTVHEKWYIEGKIGLLRSKITHYPHQTISEFLKEINYYSTLRADELAKQKVRVNAFMIVAYPLMKFKYNYFIRLGILDGIQGFLVALMMSFHSFLVRGKLWQLQKGK